MNANKTQTTSKCFLEEKREIESFVTSNNAMLTEFGIFDEGYRVRIEVKLKDMPRSKVCELMDEIDFKGYFVSDFHYFNNGMEAMLVPITQDTMNEFVWSYIAEYLSVHAEVEALNIAVGVLEHMIEPLSKSVQEEYKKYTLLVIQ